MSDLTIIDTLIDFGLTRQEAVIYECLLIHGELSGYEVSKETGISRSNVYASLNGLVEKGGAYLIEGESTKYTPVELKTFTQNRLIDLKKKAEYLEAHAPKKYSFSDGYITILGAKNISNKIREILEKTQLRLYVMAPAEILSEYYSEIEQLVKTEKKVVLLTEGFSMPGVQIYSTQVAKGQIRLISDSAYVITGNYTGNEHDTCLYSGQRNLVEVLKEALKNKITILSGNK